MQLKTKNLILREFKNTDWKAIHEYASNPTVVQYMPFGPNTTKETKEFIKKAQKYQKQKPRKNYELAITLNGELIGGCSISINNSKYKKGSIGYCLNKKYWGNGYATEAAQALIKFGFEKLKLHRIWGSCRPKNIGSQKVMQKIGMKKEGYLRENLFEKGKWQDSILFAILKQDYKK